MGDIFLPFRHLPPEAVVETPFVFKLPPKDAYFTQRYQERRACSTEVPPLADSIILQQQAPVCAVSHEMVAAVKVPIDINTPVQDQTSKLAKSASVEGLTQMFEHMLDKYAVNVYHCKGARENGIHGARRRSMHVA